MKKFVRALYRVIMTLVYCGIIFLGLNAFLVNEISIPAMIVISAIAGIVISALEVLEEKYRGL